MKSRWDVSESFWRWQYALRNGGKRNEKTLDDFSSAEMPAANTASPPSKEPPKVGGRACIRTLYEGPKSKGTYFNWVDYPPRQLSKSAARTEEDVAIRVHKIIDRSKPAISGCPSLIHHQIVVRNPLLVAAVAEVLKEQEVCMDASDSLEFNYPFRTLFFGYDAFVAKYATLAKADPLNEFLLLLIRLLDEVFAPTRAKLASLKAEGLVSFDMAWAFFPKDTNLVSLGSNCDRLTKVVVTMYALEPEPVMTIAAKTLRFHGEEFVWDEVKFEIPKFAGHKPITELGHYPLEFYEDAESLKQRFTQRGRKALDYQGITYCNYRGMAVTGDMERLNVDGRILIDVVGYNKHQLGVTPLETMRSYSKKMPSSLAKSRKATWKWLDKETQNKNKKAMLEKPEDLMFMAPVLEGYALANKRWCTFYIEDIAPIAWNTEAFDHLVYNEEQKDLVLSFVESHGDEKPQLNDVILGKGMGLIVLLSGPPGTGKTLTAEAVADRTRRPLFYLQAEDLGINAAALATKLKKILEMATEWGAVVLLDEADVFMAERHPQDIARNELVSIFLRELEYFRGVLFLTTNMYDTIDSAFRSRVSLHLLFKPLTTDARAMIWRKFLDRIPVASTPATSPRKKATVSKETGKGENAGAAKSDERSCSTKEAGNSVGTADANLERESDGLDEEDIKELAAWQLNGREIKTAVKMVKAWCDNKGHTLTLSRMENGIRATSPHASKLTHEGDVSIYD